MYTATDNNTLSDDIFNEDIMRIIILKLTKILLINNDNQNIVNICDLHKRNSLSDSKKNSPQNLPKRDIMRIANKLPNGTKFMWSWELEQKFFNETIYN